MSIQQRYERIPEFTTGDRLRKARESAGLGQEEMAEATGLSRGTVSNLELNKAPLKSSYLKLWAMATGVPVEWLQWGKVQAGDDDGSRSRAASMGTGQYPDRLAA